MAIAVPAVMGTIGLAGKAAKPASYAEYTAMRAAATASPDALQRLSVMTTGHPLGAVPSAARGAAALATSATARVRRFGGAEDARSAVRHVLSTGDTVREVYLPRAEAGINGPRRAFETGTVDGVTVTGLAKDFTEQAPQEVLAERVATALGISHLLPVVGLRGDNSVLMQVVPGAAAGRAGIYDASSLEYTLSRWYETEHGLSRGDAYAQAQHDRQMIAVFDYIMANSDRRSANLMIDESTAAAKLIDHGHIGVGELIQGGTAEVPVMMPEYVRGRPGAGGVSLLELDPAVVETLRGIDPAELRAQHAASIGVQDARPMKHSMSKAWNHVRSSAFADNMVARLTKLQTTGELRYRPFSNLPVLPPLAEGVGPAPRGLRDAANRF